MTSDPVNRTTTFTRQLTNTNYTLNPGIFANRVYTIPDVGTNANFVTNGTQTIDGAQTFTGADFTYTTNIEPPRLHAVEIKSDTNSIKLPRMIVVGDTHLAEDDVKELLKLIPENRQLKERLAKLEKQFGPIVDHLASRTRTTAEFDQLEKAIAKNAKETDNKAGTRVESLDAPEHGSESR